MPKLRRGRPPLEKRLGPLRIPRLTPAMFPEAARFTQTVRGLTLKRVEVARLQEIDHETILLRCALERRIPHTSAALEAMGRDACAQVLAARRSVAAFHAYIRRELGRRRAFKTPERGRALMVYLWDKEPTGRRSRTERGKKIASSAAKFARCNKSHSTTANRLADKFDGSKVRRLDDRAYKAELAQDTTKAKTVANDWDRLNEKWRVTEHRERRRVRDDNPPYDKRSVALHKRALAHQREQGCSYKDALLAVARKP